MPCLEVYPPAKYPELADQFKNDVDPKTYASIDWQCLPPGNFEILGDTWAQSRGVSTQLGIDYCKNLAPKIGFDGANCL